MICSMLLVHLLLLLICWLLIMLQDKWFKVEYANLFSIGSSDDGYFFLADCKSSGFEMKQVVNCFSYYYIN
ncbi:hypothetical protein Hanom_Chr15g01377181 [Helianthus anomalus]